MISKLLSELNEKTEELNNLIKNEGFFIDLEKRISMVNNENERLNNIINELEKWLEEEQKLYGINQQGFSWGVAGDCLDKLKELKGGGKEWNM